MSDPSQSIRTAICLLALSVITGCGYGEVSPKAYEFTQALYSISNRQATDKLLEFQSQLGEATAAGELTESEVQLLRDIAATAEAGDWKSAQQECRQLMNAQVK